MKNYFEARANNCILKTREVLKELPTFSDMFFVGVEQSTSPLTRLNYAYDLRVFFEYLMTETDLFDKDLRQLHPEDLNKISAQTIENFLSYLSHYSYDNKEYSNGDQGKSRKLSTIKTFFSYFYNKGFINENVTQKVKMPKLHEKPIIKLEADEIAKLITITEAGSSLTDREKAFHQYTKERDVAIITLMLGTGIRVSECVGLNLEDVDFDVNGIKITRKGGNQEIVYFGDEVRESLLSYLVVRNKNKQARNENAVFLSLQNRRINVRTVQLLVKKYASATTPLKKITPHKLRSTYGTELYRETQDIYIVADVLGHKDVTTTKKHYAAISEDLRKNVANKVKLRD
ncbi:MAG: tyrosine-type recombinase/integrase [Clostridia bacterium]|nr:tyrosine-type recombinase/integrase [Clostridia bacterium]